MISDRNRVAEALKSMYSSKGVTVGKGPGFYRLRKGQVTADISDKGVDVQWAGNGKFFPKGQSNAALKEFEKRARI